MDHDRPFKELLRPFFFEFLELFFPSLAALIDRSHDPVFLDKEDFGELPVDLRREVDLVARLRLLAGDAYFIVHLEHEAQASSDFPVRMFRYFSRLWDRHGLPVYPVALFSFPGRKVQPKAFTLQFHDLAVLDFSWGAFLKSKKILYADSRAGQASSQTPVFTYVGDPET